MTAHPSVLSIILEEIGQKILDHIARSLKVVHTILDITVGDMEIVEAPNRSPTE